MDPALAKKLMVEKFSSILILDKPQGLGDFNGLAYDTRPRGKYGLIISFVFSLDEMEQAIIQTAEKDLLDEGGYLYLAYPKKGNPDYEAYIERDSIFPRLRVDEETGFAGDIPLKFVKMVALNSTFTIVGLKYDPHREARKNAAGSRVDDYIEMIPSLRESLGKKPKFLALFDTLPYGYQKDWARHVYSAKSEATREKRLAEMIEILAAGYKSKDLFRRGKK